MNAASIETLIDYGAASRPATGETVSGDLYLVKKLEDGALLAVVDGVGHGGEAIAAALTATMVLEREAGTPLPMLVQECHKRMTGTRGAVMTLARINASDNTLEWLAVG